MAEPIEDLILRQLADIRATCVTIQQDQQRMLTQMEDLILRRATLRAGRLIHKGRMAEPVLPPQHRMDQDFSDLLAANAWALYVRD